MSVAGEQFAEVAIGLAVGVFVLLVGSVLRRLHDPLADVADGHVLHVAAAEEGPLIAGAHVAHADPAHDDAVAGGRNILITKSAWR